LALPPRRTPADGGGAWPLQLRQRRGMQCGGAGGAGRRHRRAVAGACRAGRLAIAGAAGAHRVAAGKTVAGAHPCLHRLRGGALDGRATGLRRRVLPAIHRAATIALRHGGAGDMREAVHAAGTRVMGTGDAGSRNPGIDALRGLAIVLVVFNHLGLRIPLEKTALAGVLPTWLLNRLNWNGYEAVYVFFVISGFLIAGNALRRWGSLAAIDVRAFYARRFARIVPCLLALLAVLSVLHLLG